jgi:chromosome partitioning protein
MRDKPEIITIANFTGGCGKSTTCVHLGHALALQGKSCLLVDCDPQGQLAIMLGMRQESCVYSLLMTGAKSDQLRYTGRKNLWLIPGDAMTAVVQSAFKETGSSIHDFRKRFEPILGDFKYCIIDTSSSFNNLQAAALFIADYVLIPVAVDLPSTKGTIYTLEKLREIKQGRSQENFYYDFIFPTFSYRNDPGYNPIPHGIPRELIKYILPGIRQSSNFRECTAFGKTMFEFDSKFCQQGIHDYNSLLEYLFRCVYEARCIRIDESEDIQKGKG